MRGKSFEREISQSLAAMSKCSELKYWNSNAPKPICDHLVLSQGRAILLEEKEVAQERMPFGAISTEERRNLSAFVAAGCKAYVLIKCTKGAYPRVWSINWEDWLILEQVYGYDHTATRNARGTGSFPLSDGHRPCGLRELERVQRRDCDGHSLGWTWDLWMVADK